jgi:NAD(P)-dependent dehydrogenase (short-subunit alcohol dehydrogenase family)
MVIETFGAKSTPDKVLSGVDLKGKRYLVMGESSGIGLETARSLAPHGASVVGVFRDIVKAEIATTSVHKAALYGSGNFELIELELASLQSNDAPTPFADGVRSYALDANKANHLWAEGEALDKR